MAVTAQESRPGPYTRRRPEAAARYRRSLGRSLQLPQDDPFRNGKGDSSWVEDLQDDEPPERKLGDTKEGAVSSLKCNARV